MTVKLTGRIDSNNAAQTEKEILEQLSSQNADSVVLDAEELTYISSAGLRVLLRIRKTFQDMRIIHVNPEVYEILDMTGFTEMMTVEKAYRVVSVEGCEEIGRGANGTIYRIDQDNVVKVYNNADALEDIQHEREVAKLALILGIPTAISYDVVKVGNSYGSVFELLNASSFSKILSTHPERMDWCVREYVDLLKKIHGTEVPAGKLPDMKEKVLSWAHFVKDYLPEETGNKLISLVSGIPHDDHMIHGDYHTKNVELQGNEVLLIDMDTLAIGHPIFELGSMFNSYVGFSEQDHDVILQFQGFDFDTASVFWHKTLSMYLKTACASKIREVEDKARIIGYTRLLRRAIRRGGLEDPAIRPQISFWQEKLTALIAETDTLTFSLNELELTAEAGNLDEVQTFVRERLDDASCLERAKKQIAVAVEEIFINIAQYAYSPETGKAVVRTEVSEDPVTVTITFMDHGIPYDPLAKEDPDVTLSADERMIGGLGIFLARQLMDDVVYEYRDGKNILTLKKNL